jgi:histidine ammonia-lyase
MSAEILLTPGFAALSTWQAIYRGARVSIDPVARADVEAGAAAIAAIIAEEPGRPPENGNGAPSAEVAEKEPGTPFAPLSRLFVALKLGSLGQGVSGVRWETIEALAALLDSDLLPPIPAGNMSDRLALALLAGAMTGTGEVIAGGRRVIADRALEEAGLAPVSLTGHEKRALVTGTELSTAAALAGLFEAERLLHSAVVAATLSTTSLSPSPPFHPRAHQLHRHGGQIDVAAAMRELLGCDDSEAAQRKDNGVGATDARSTPVRLGACFDLLRQAGKTLKDAANAVTETPVVLWQTDQVVAGIEDASSAAFAADLIAMAIREIAELSKRRIGVIVSSLEPTEAAENGVGGPRTTATTILGEIRRRSYPTGLDASGTRRLLPMAGNATRLLAIEVMLAAWLEPGSRARSGAPADTVRRLLRQSIARPEYGADMAPEAAVAAIDLVSAGALIDAAGVALPSVARF